MGASTATSRIEAMEKENGQIPAIVITFPFRPTMTPKGQIEDTFRKLSDEAERQLQDNFPKNTVSEITRRLKQVRADLSFATHKKGLAVFISPSITKTLYLDFPIEKKCLIDPAFRIRNLVTGEASAAHYLVLVLSSTRSKLFNGEGTQLTIRKTNGFQPAAAYSRELPEQVGNFTDVTTVREVLLHKFLRHMDDGLSVILETEPLPVFVLGPKRVLGHFSELTHNGRHIAGYIYKHCMNAPEKEILDFLAPFLRNWDRIRQELSLKQVESAIDSDRLNTGIDPVVKAAGTHNNRLLVVESGFEVPFNRRPSAFYIHDRVDAVIEKVLECGGSVEWVDEGRLADYGHIALVRHF